MNFTEQQQGAIEKRGKIIVSAAAGSGKTAVMIERLVSLILSGTDVREVLAVTFTNKAAAQMRERLRGALLERIASSEGAEKERLKRELLNLPLAEISTIHAFCGRLVRTNFYLAETDAAFRIIPPDDAEGRTLINRALDRVFEEAYEEGGERFIRLLSAYFRKKKDTRLREIILNLHENVRGLADYREVLARAGEDGFGDACAYLLEHFRARVEYLLAGLEEGIAYFKEHHEKANAVGKEVEGACRALFGAETLFDMVQIATPPLKLPNTPPKTKATGETLAHLTFLGGASKSIKAIYAELREFSTEEVERERSRDASERAGALASLVLRFDEKYSSLKQEANVLDYNDLEQLALKVLLHDDARKGLQERFKYIFVDEYQDVNLVQERILSLLAGEEIFLVGDSKQAIYGFRGSNSAFFEEKRRELSGRGGDLPLTRNFRSAAEVLRAVNRVFTPISSGYEPMEGGDRYGNSPGEVIFHRVEKEKREREKPNVYSVLEHTGEEQRGGAGGEPEPPLTQRIADIIESELTRTFYDADAGEERKVELSDIAVLVRKKSGEMERIVRELSRRDIPVTASANVNVCDFPEARLLIDWLSYLDNAAQDIPMATAMLSAVGGFTEGELAEIRLRYPLVYNFRAACEYYMKGSGALSRKLKEFSQRTQQLRAQAQVLSAAEMLALLLAEGLEAQIAAMPHGKLRLARIRRLIAESEKGAGVHAFLARLKASDYRVMYAGGGGESAVQVLTMHAAKGLEYPVVILADLDIPFHGPEKSDVMWTERFLFAPNSFDTEKGIVYETLSRRASAKVQEEEERAGERNLLYVAMTRAKYRLHMLFEDKERLSPTYAKRLSDFIDLTACGDYFVSYEERGNGPLPVRALAGEADEDTVQKIIELRRRPYAYPESVTLPVKSSATELMRGHAQQPVSGGSQGHSTEEGTAYHAFLEHVRFGQDAGEELARMEREGLLPPEQLALLEVDRLYSILAIPCLKEAAGKRVYREQTFLISLPACEVYEDSTTQDEVVFQGAIDLLVEDENGFTIIDYKLSARSDESLRTHYAPQIALYKKAVAGAMGVDENTIRARLVNIALCREIDM